MLKKVTFKVRKLGYQIYFGSKLGSKLKNSKFDKHYRICAHFAHILICHKQYVEKNIFKVRKLGYQICFGSKLGSKLKNAKFDTHYRIGVTFPHILICHKPYVEKHNFKVPNWGLKLGHLGYWAQFWVWSNNYYLQITFFTLVT